MTCRALNLGNGVSAIVCSRGVKPAKMHRATQNGTLCRQWTVSGSFRATTDPNRVTCARCIAKARNGGAR